MPRLSDSQYRDNQLSRALLDHPDTLVLKIKDPKSEYSETKWLNITRSEFDAIRKILTDGK